MLTVRNPLEALASAFNKLPAPQAADSSNSSGGLWTRPTSDRAAQLAAYNAVSTLRQVVSSLSEDTSRVEWHMHRIRQRTSVNADRCPLCDKENVVLLEKHPALVRWNEPNDWMTGQEFREGYQQHIELTGEGYWVLDILDAGMFSGVQEMWYVRPDRMEPVKSKEKFLVGWIYSAPDGEQVPLEVEQVIPLKSPDPVDIYRGSGATQTLLNDIRASVKSAMWTDKFFENSAVPGGVISVDGELGDTQFKNFARRWREQHRGLTNAHRVAILEHQGKWQTISFSPKDMLLTDLRKFTAEHIREAWGFPEFASGKLQNANRASSEAADTWYTQRMIVPRLDKTRGALNHRYLKRWGSTGQNVEFAYSDPVPPSAEVVNAERESKAGAYKMLIDSGVHPDDAAMVVGLPPMRTVARATMSASGRNADADTADVGV